MTAPAVTKNAWASALMLRDGTAADVRRVLKREGWAIAVRDPVGPVDRHPRLDFCPTHRPS